jgi:hypothetical protein
MVTNKRRALLIAALGFARLEFKDPPPVLTALKTWLGSWAGLGAIITGMNRQGFNIELREYPHGWRANFYPAGTAHSIVVGSRAQSRRQHWKL